MSDFQSIVVSALRRTRRRFNQFRGRDVPYRLQVRVPSRFLGSEYGGWTVQPKLLDRHSIVYSFGIGQDISFDRAMIDEFDCEIQAFDPTPKSMEWLSRQALPAKFKFTPIGAADFDGSARFVLPRADYVSFQIASGVEGDAIDCPVQRVGTIMSRLNHSQVDLLKMDIEGAEYAVLQDVLAENLPIRQLLVEFHHVLGDKPSLARTQKAIEALNAAGYRIFSISPVGFEYSFIRI